MIDKAHIYFSNLTGWSVYYAYLPPNKNVSQALVYMDADAEIEQTFSVNPNFSQTSFDLDFWGKDPTSIAVEVNRFISNLPSDVVTIDGIKFYHIMVDNASTSFETDEDLFRRSISVTVSHSL